MRLMSLTAQVMAPIPLWDLPTIPSCQARPQSPCLKATQRSAPSPKTVCCASTHKPISLKALLTVAGQAYRATAGSRDIQAFLAIPAQAYQDILAQAYQVFQDSQASQAFQGCLDFLVCQDLVAYRVTRDQAFLVIQALVFQVIQGQVFLGFRGLLDSLGSVAFQASQAIAAFQAFQGFLGFQAFLDSVVFQVFQEFQDSLALQVFQASRDIAATIQDQVAFLGSLDLVALLDFLATQGLMV